MMLQKEFQEWAEHFVVENMNSRKNIIDIAYHAYMEGYDHGKDEIRKKFAEQNPAHLGDPR